MKRLVSWLFAAASLLLPLSGGGAQTILTPIPGARPNTCPSGQGVIGYSGYNLYLLCGSISSGGAGLSTSIDSSFGSTQGSILYRGASSWAALPPGTSGQFLETLGASANPAWGSPSGSGTVSSVGLSASGIFGVTGSPVTGIGTLGLTVTGTSGGIPYFASGSALASSQALVVNQLVLGGGAGAAPATLGSLGTATTVLHGNAAGAPSFGAVVLSTDVSGNLPNSSLATQTANTVLGATTATTPSGLAMPSCSGASSALTWTTGTGFGCNTISGGGSGTVNSGSSPAIAQYQGASSTTVGPATVSGDATMAAGGALTVTKTGGVAFGALATESAITTAQLPALASTDLWVGNGSNVATAVGLSGDCALSNAGAITCTKTSGTAFGALATENAITGGQLPALTSGDFWLGNGSNAATAVAMPAATDLVISGGNAAPSGLAPVNGDCVTGSGGAWVAGSCSSSAGANPTATAGPAAINGVATTFMRSDAAPAVQVGSASQEGILEVGGGLSVSAGIAQLAAVSAVSHEWINSVNASGVAQLSQPAFTDISGQATNAQLATQTANTLLGAVTATTPSGIAVPSCTDTAGNHLNWTSGAGFSCGTSSSGGSTTITPAPGLGNSQTTANLGGTGQNVTNGSTLYPQMGTYSLTASYTLNAATGTTPCTGSALCDTARLLLADGSSAITFTAPNPAGTLAPYQMGDQTGHGFTVTTVGGTATFFGCVSGSPTSVTVPANFTIQLADQGSSANTYYCVEQPQIGLAANVADQTISGGANVTSDNLGTQSSGTLTIDCGARPLQYVTDGGAFTLAAPANDGSCMLLVTNNASAGAITFSGFSVGSNTGDALDTTNTHKFTLDIWRINGTAGYRVAAHQ